MSQAEAKSDQTIDLTFDQRVRLIQLVQEVRQSLGYNSPGLIGLMETRNLFARLFPDFAQVRDNELDDLLERYVSDTLSRSEEPLPEDDNPDRL